MPMLCRVLVKVPGEENESVTFTKPRDVPNRNDSTRKSWVNGIKQFNENGTEANQIRPLDFQLSLDGSVERQPSSHFSLETSDLIATYPSHYRIPPETITELDASQKIRRSELFAIGSLIYEIYANEAPFESLDDHEVQARYRKAEFPDVTHLPQWPIILSCWSVEFARELHASLSK